MAIPKFSFNVISQEEFDARRKEEAVAATTAALSAKPPRRFTVAYGVPGLFSTIPMVPNAQPAAQVTIPVFAMLRVPATILYLSLMLLFFAVIHIWHIVLEFVVFATFRFFSNQRIRL